MLVDFTQKEPDSRRLYYLTGASYRCQRSKNDCNEVHETFGGELVLNFITCLMNLT